MKLTTPEPRPDWPAVRVIHGAGELVDHVHPGCVVTVAVIATGVDMQGLN